MPDPNRHTPGPITQYLQQWQAGDPDALHHLTAAVYAELRRLAAAMLRGRYPGCLQPTELVHELYLELHKAKHIKAENKVQFLGLASSVMRNLLVDHARKRNAAKRGGGAIQIEFSDSLASGAAVDVLIVHDLLLRFAESYPRQADVVELRFFGGLTAVESVEILRARGHDTSVRTVDRDWRFARAWLQSALTVASIQE